MLQSMPRDVCPPHMFLSTNFEEKKKHVGGGQTSQAILSRVIPHPKRYTL